MAVTNFSPLLGLALPTTGDLTGTWGDTVNTSITSLIDSAVAGTTTLSTDADVTLSITNGASNQARNAVILWTATGSTTRYITAPAQSKAYIIVNASGGSQSIVIRGAGPTTGVTVTAGNKALVAWNGTDFVKITGGPINLTTDVTGVLPVANGGTALSSVGSNGNVLTVVAGAPSWQPPSVTIGPLVYNTTTVSANASVPTGQNAFSVGPITVDSGFSVTVASGQRWVVV